MEGDPKAAAEAEEQDRTTRNRGIGLCLSGGGFRATLFHLGVSRRLFKLGITARPDFDTIAAVSGGSLTLAQWAIAEGQAKAENRSIDLPRYRAPNPRPHRNRHPHRPLVKKFLLPWN